MFGDLNQYPNANSVDPTYLKFKVNKEDDESLQDCALENDDYIAIGDPSINVDQNQIFIKSESIDSDSHMLANIIITENDIPVINSIDNLVIYLPENLHIYDGAILGLPNNISWDADLNSNDPFDSCVPSDNILTCLLNDEFEVFPNETFIISGLRVIPQDNLSSIDDLCPLAKIDGYSKIFRIFTRRM